MDFSTQASPSFINVPYSDPNETTADIPWNTRNAFMNMYEVYTLVWMQVNLSSPRNSAMLLNSEILKKHWWKHKLVGLTKLPQARLSFLLSSQLFLPPHCPPLGKKPKEGHSQKHPQTAIPAGEQGIRQAR